MDTAVGAFGVAHTDVVGALVWVCAVRVSQDNGALYWHITHGMSGVVNIVFYGFLAILFYAFFVAVLNFLPDATSLPAGVSTAITLIYGYMQLFNFFFPIDTLVTVLLASLVLQGAIYAWYVARWIIGIVSNWFGT